MKKLFRYFRQKLNWHWLCFWWDKKCLSHDSARVISVFGHPKDWGKVTFPAHHEVELNTTDESQLNNIRLMAKQKQ